MGKKDRPPLKRSPKFGVCPRAAEIHTLIKPPWKNAAMIIVGIVKPHVIAQKPGSCKTANGSDGSW